MSTTSTPEALWGVGSYSVGDEIVTYPVSPDDSRRDMGTAAKALASLGVQAGSRVLVVSMLSEAAQYWPVQIGLLMAQAQFSLADASRFDAFRTVMFIRAMHYDAVVGVNNDVLDGLDDLGTAYDEVFGPVGIVAARAGAHERLREAGLDPRWWLHVGPTIAVECRARAGAHVDGDEWSVQASAGGEVLVTARRARAATIDRQSTGVFGAVITDPCACGRDDPRVVPESAPSMATT